VLADELARALAPVGLNLIGVTTPAAYDALVPPSHRLAAHAATTRSIVVIGNGGRAFWAAYRAHVDAHPDHAGRSHPLDDFTTAVMEEHVVPRAARLGIRGELHLPYRETTPPVSFVHLAEAAGLGRRSLLGVLVHPEYGPWMALRGALFVDVALAAPRPAAGFDPCTSCRTRPCLAACPADAMVYPAGWDVPRCIAFRVAQARANPCADRCHARVACVYGRVHRYPDDALAHHQERAFAVMRRYAGSEASGSVT
jgi:hypothetical protein